MKTLKFLGRGKVLITIMVLFMLSWVTLLSSCTAVVRTPRHSGSTVYIQGQVGDENRDHDRKRERREHRENHERD
jgi:hypothetical protein